MQIVIDIPDNKYQWIKDNPLTYDNEYCEAIRNGTPLPKGHGRLIDADAIVMPMLETETDEKWMRVAINSAPTIIEADKAESEG